MRKPEHPIKILMRPMMFLLEQRLENMLMIAYNEGYKDGMRFGKMWDKPKFKKLMPVPKALKDKFPKKVTP